MITENYEQFIMPLELIYLYKTNMDVSDLYKKRVKICCAYTNILIYDTDHVANSSTYKNCMLDIAKVIYNPEDQDLIPLCPQHAMFSSEYINNDSEIYFPEEIDAKINKIIDLIDLIG